MDLDATPAERRLLEYATQHFSFTPDSLTDTITTFALENLDGVIDSMRSHCTKMFAKKVPEKDMRDAFALIQDKYTTSTEKVLDNMSAYAKKNILAVPANIVLPEDRVYLAKPTYTGDQMSEDLKAFDRLCASSKTMRYKLAVMEAKLSNLKRVKEAQVSLAQEAKVLDEANRDIDTAVTEKTAELQKKVVKLRSLMAQLEAALETGGATEDASNEDRKRKLAEVHACSLVIAKRLKSSSSEQPTAPSSEPGKENQVCLDNTTSTVNGTVLNS